MYLLCKKEKRAAILEWGESFHNGNFIKEDFEGIPNNYLLFKILNPVKSCPDIPLLTLFTEKTIELTGGLKMDFRTYINDFLPEVEITNSNGNENVYLQYRHSEEKVFLSNRYESSNRWLLPENLTLNTNFYIKVEDENFVGNEIAYKITSPDNSANQINETQLPKRDPFGRIIKHNVSNYCLGSNIVNPMKSSLRFYSPWASLFITNREHEPDEFNNPVYFNHSGNRLSSFLTAKAVLATEDFYQSV